MESNSSTHDQEDSKSSHSKRHRHDKENDSRKHSHRDRSRDRGERRSHKDDRRRHHHHSSQPSPSRHHRSRDEDGHRRKRSRHSHEENSKSVKVQDAGTDTEDVDGMWVEKSTGTDVLKVQNEEKAPIIKLKRDAWMEEAGMEIDYTQRGARNAQESSKTTASSQVVPDWQVNLSSKELNIPLKEGLTLDTYNPPKPTGPQFKFGDAGSDWRMRKLKNVYLRAKEDSLDVDKLGIEVFGSLREFDEAREERQELDRREIYGMNRKDFKEYPTGDLYAERNINENSPDNDEEAMPQGQVIGSGEPPKSSRTVKMDQSALNKLRASLMKAQLRGDSKAAQLEAEYNLALASFSNSKEPEVVVLSAMDSRLLAGGSRTESVEITSGKNKGKRETNHDMTIDDMVREERRTKGQVNEGKLFAERIAKDGKYDDNLDYMDENADKLANRVQHKDINLKNMAIHEFKKMQKVLDTCPLCQHDDKATLAPVISLGTRVFLSLPTEPELSGGGATIVPIQHRNNTLECDDDEWEEIRNFMKCLIRMYHDQGRDVIFYENAAAPHRRRHAAIEAVPLPLEQAEIAPAFFKEAFLSADEEWAQHKKIIDTLSLSRKGLGKQAFRRSVVKEAPYFHVWFEIDGGMGHIVEDENRWPKGDLFAREIIGGMLDCEPDVIKRQGRWQKGKDRREDQFKKGWKQFDWTRVLLDG